MEKYTIRITTECGLYKDYEIQAANLFFAKMLARNKFFKEFPGAEENIVFSVINPSKKALGEILDKLKENIMEEK